MSLNQGKTKRVCIIPARKNSKRLPGKNVKLLNKKPLIQYTIDAVVLSGIFDEVILTSDSQDILDIATGNITREIRPEDLSTDTSKVINTVSFYFNKISTDEIWLSLPTCPFKTPQDFINCASILEVETSIVSIMECVFPPTLSLVEHNNYIHSLIGVPWEMGNSRSQDHQVSYRPNGAIYGIKSKDFLEHRNFYTHKTFGYKMAQSIDIDTPFDFKMAEFMMQEYRSSERY